MSAYSFWDQEHPSVWLATMLSTHLQGCFQVQRGVQCRVFPARGRLAEGYCDTQLGQPWGGSGSGRSTTRHPCTHCGPQQHPPGLPPNSTVRSEQCSTACPLILPPTMLCYLPSTSVESVTSYKIMPRCAFHVCDYHRITSTHGE